MFSSAKRAAVVIAAAAAAVFAAPVGAYAGDTGNITIPITSVEVDGAKTTAMTGSVAEYAGDCSMNVPSFVRIYPPTAAGQSLILWEGWGYTRHTNHADVWNLYLNVEDAWGNFLFSAPAMHGAQMTQWYQVYGWDRYVTVPLTQDQFNRIGATQWIATC